jgi:hypothetical protein
MLWEAAKAAHFFHHKAVSGQTDGRETLVRIPEEQTIIIMASDGDVISVHEDVAKVIFPVIAQQRERWEQEELDITAHHYHPGSALSFDDWG